jgi:Arc/MetJ-type ribon-helix-helix transcriptional regulator
VKAAVKEMRGSTKRWNEVAEDVLERNPKLAERISEEVNAGLGDYFSMSDFERRAVRRVAPFYAWYKAITRITLMLPIDYPVRALALTQLGKLGAEMESETTEGLPPWLAGSVGLGDEYTISTQAANPLSTVTSMGRGVLSDDWYAQQQRLGLLHPFLPALAGVLSQRSFDPAAKVVTGLPPWRLARPPHRASYEGNDRLRELYSYLGIPVKKPVRGK